MNNLPLQVHLVFSLKRPISSSLLSAEFPAVADDCVIAFVVLGWGVGVINRSLRGHCALPLAIASVAVLAALAAKAN